MKDSAFDDAIEIQETSNLLQFTTPGSGYSSNTSFTLDSNVHNSTNELKKINNNNNNNSTISLSNVSTASSIPDREHDTRELSIILLGAAAGNFLEWFNFAIYGLMAETIGQLFFPPNPNNSTFSLIQVYGLFAGSFIARPFGGILFGWIGDKYGRLISLKISIIAMFVSTLLFAMLPTYSTIGIYSTLMVVLLRLLQGISVGGEFTGSLLYVTEICPIEHRALFAQLCQITGMGNILANLFIILLNLCFTNYEILSFAWRIPYIFGCLIGIFGIWARYYLTKDSPLYLKEKKHGNLKKNPLKYAIFNYKLRMCAMMIHYTPSAFCYYVLWIWFPVYLSQIDPTFLKYAFATNLCGMLAGSILSCVVSHYLVDKLTKTTIKVFIPFGFIFAFLSFILFPYFDDDETDDSPNDPVLMIVIMFILSCSFGAYWGPVQLWSVDIFPDVSCRYSAFGLAYNLSTIVGGMAPLLSEFIIGHFQGIYSIGYTICILTIICLISDIIATYFNHKKCGKLL